MLSVYILDLLQGGIMGHIVRLFKILLLVSGLIACVNPPNPTETLPIPTSSPVPSAPAMVATSVEMDNQQETFVIGDAWFTSNSIAVKSSESVAVASADFDADGHLDLVISGDPQLTILRGDGRGGLISSVRVPGGQQPIDFALADLDEDGDVDIVAANHDTDYLTVLLGDGNGDFQPAPVSPLHIAVSPHPHAVNAADLDGDGHVDLIVDHRQAEGLLVLRGLGTGGFESPGTLVEVGGDPYRGMAIGDLNGDAKPDLVTPNPDDAGVILNESHAGQISFHQASPVAAEAPFAVELADFNGDGQLDLIAASDEVSPLVEIFLGNGHGGFTQATGSPVNFALGAKNITVGDFNADGIADAAVACWQSSDVLVLLGGRDDFLTGSLPGGEHPWGLAAVDLNEDGVDDLVIADDASPQAAVYLSLGR